MRVRLRYQVMESAGGEDNVEANIVNVEEEHELDPSECALVLVDTWNRHHVVSHEASTARIMREKIAPILPLVRAARVPVIYAPSPDVAERYPQELRGRGDSEAKGAPEPTARAARTGSWPPSGWRERMSRRPGEYPTGHEFRQPWDAVHESIAPEPGDCVVATGDELHEALAERRRSILFYVGFATNICVLHRDYGVLAMGARGYLPILLRDCTIGIETRESLGEMLATRAAIQDVERRYYTALSTDLVLALQDRA